MSKTISHSNTQNDGNEAILQPGDTVWKTVRADRAAVLADGAGYFGVLREALLEARESIFIVGWDIDSRARIVGKAGAADDGAPEELGELLGFLATRRAGLDIYVLPWDYSLMFMPERELLPKIALGWRTPEHVHVCLDSTAPAGSSHHQKLVVIDDSIAFCGGLDLTIRRWDTADHDYANPARKDPDDIPYAPYHDYQVIADGEAARTLGEVARGRWSEAGGTTAKPVSDTVCPWPTSVEPDFEQPSIGIARTRPESLEGPGIDEVERLYHRAISAAERVLYIENQYLHDDEIAAALAARAEANPALEIVIVSNQESGGWLEERTMGMGRRRFMSILMNSPASDRIRILRSTVSSEDETLEVHIHAKLLIVDDKLLRIGSSNINKRSMGLDTECDLAIEAANDDERRRITVIRDRFIAHHLGVSADRFRTDVERFGSPIAAIDAHRDGAHALQPIDPDHPEPLLNEELEVNLSDVTDPKAPPHHAALAAAMEMREPETKRNGIPIRVVVAAVLTIVLIALWYATPISDFADVETLEPYFEQVAKSGWAPVAVPLIFVVASMIFFPVTILIALTGMTLGPWLGIACAAAGCLGSAAVSFGLGTLLGENGLRRLMGKRLNRISKGIADKGILSVAGLRLLPVAPFTAINLIAGATHIRLGDFIIGTALGMAPGIVLMTALGDRLHAVWRNPSVENMVVLGFVAACWLAVAFGLQLLISKRRKSR